jgi:hypothetical protein
MQIQLLYFNGCPNWHDMHDRLREAMASAGDDGAVELVEVRSPAQAAQWGFHGSPSILVDGQDPFAEPGAAVGLACRLYRTPDGLRGAPSMDQLAAVLAR